METSLDGARHPPESSPEPAHKFYLIEPAGGIGLTLLDEFETVTIPLLQPTKVEQCRTVQDGGRFLCRLTWSSEEAMQADVDSGAFDQVTADLLGRDANEIDPQRAGYMFAAIGEQGTHGPEWDRPQEARW